MNPSPPPASRPPPGKRARRRVLGALVALAALAAYALSGFYFVQPERRAVVRWFGRVPAGQKLPPYGVGPGVHYALPWPICRVDRPQTTAVRQVYVGTLPEQRAAIEHGDVAAMQASPASDILTGDVNILKVTMAVHYRIGNVVEYVLAAERPDELVRATVQAVLIETLGAIPVDEALTSAKSRLENLTQQQAQRLLDAYGCGLKLVATNIETIEPPRAIAPAFMDVVSAKKDGEREIDRAVAEANRILPRARGDAAKLAEEAQAYLQQRLSRARADAYSFLELLAEYRAAPEVTRDRLRLQTFERVLARVRTILADSKPGETPARVLIVDEAPE